MNGDRRGRSGTLTLLGLSDVHGVIRSHDYERDAPSDPARGLARAATAAMQIRASAAPGSVLLLDAGDSTQGTPLTADPRVIAAALNAAGVQAAAVGNHDLDRGWAVLQEYADSCDFPLLAANLRGARPAVATLRPWVVLEATVPEVGAVRVGVLGLTTPGTGVWNRWLLAGTTFVDLIGAARRSVDAVRAAGAEVVVVLSHSGLGPGSTYDAALAPMENATARLIEEVPGIDAVLLGHAHETIATTLRCAATGSDVPTAEPGAYGSHVARIELRLTRAGDALRVVGARVGLVETACFDEHPAVVAAVDAAHRRTRLAGAETVATSAAAVPLAGATLGHNPLIAAINHVQATTVARMLRGTPYGDRPVVSVTAPLSRTAGLPDGEVRMRDLLGIYPFDNTLVAVSMTGAGLTRHLEHAAAYFRGLDDLASVDLAALTNAPSPLAPDGIPDYNYDVAGAEANQLSYRIDLTAPVGARIADLRHAGVPLDDDQPVVVAMSGYRAAGGGGYPGTGLVPPTLDTGLDIRTLLAGWLREVSPVSLDTFGSPAWLLTVGEDPLPVGPAGR